ncbi:EthD domain-containing protein [Corynebacterium sp. S7]
MNLHHRIAFLIPREDTFPTDSPEAMDKFHEHWNNAHGEFVMPVTDVVGYVQNRPVDNQWHWDQFHGIAELFFSSPEGEEAAWAHQAWKAKLAPDEEYMFDVENGFSAIVENVEELRAGEVTRTRVLSLGGSVENLPVYPRIGATHRITLSDTVPVESGSNELISVFTRGRDEAEKVAGVLGGRTVIVDAIQMIRPEGWPNV